MPTARYKKIASNTGSVVTPVEDLLQRHGRDITKLDQRVEWIIGLTAAFALVCLIAFVTFIIDAYNRHAEEYKEYKNTLDTIQNNFQQREMEELRDRIRKLETQLTPTPTGIQ